MKKFASTRPKTLSAILWVLAVILTVVCVIFQDKTGPTYPLEGKVTTLKGEVKYKFLRSENIGTDLLVMLVDPVPEGVTGQVRFRRYKSRDEWRTMDMKAGTFTYTRRGRSETVKGVAAMLPGLAERAGKYEYFVDVGVKGEEAKSVTGKAPVFARYKAEVPTWALLAHILAIFGAMTIAIRTVLEAIVDGNYKWMLWVTLASLLVGAFVLGPIVQYYAFGVWWSGFPYGYDWTDNKVLVELIAWIPAVLLNLGKRRNRISIYGAGVVTLAVYFIPHSIFGSEFDYRTGTGHGTAG
jgi:hypothetical protein